MAFVLKYKELTVELERQQNVLDQLKMRKQQVAAEMKNIHEPVVILERAVVSE